MKKLFILIGILVICATATQAQLLHNLYGISWEVSFPTGKAFVSSTSFLGGKFEYRRFIKRNISLGTTLGWNNYEQYVSRETYENADQTQAITTDNQRFIFNLPVTVDGMYYFEQGKHFRPYVGLGLGAQYSSQEAYFNIFVKEDKNWGFVARPQIGAYVPFSEFSHNGLILGAGYNFATNKNETFRIDNMQSFWVSIGIAFTN
jgi:outer membrane protein W